MSGSTPWPKLNMNGPRENACRIASIERSSAAPPTNSASGSRFPWIAPLRLDAVPHERELGRPVYADRIDANGLEIAFELGSGAAGKPDDRCFWNALAQLRDNPCARLDAPFAEFVGRQHSRPGVENLYGIDSCRKLPGQIARRGLDQNVDQFRKNIRKPIRKQPRRKLIGRANSRDHVGCQSPRRAAETQERNRRRQVLLDPGNGLIDRLQPRVVDLPIKPLQGGRAIERIEPRPLALFECHALAQRMRHHQDIGKQDRRVEPEAPDRLQCDLCRTLSVKAQIEEPGRLLADCPVLRKVAASLPHQPDRRHRLHRLPARTRRRGLIARLPGTVSS